jgi:hypothetical protein
MVPQLLLFSFLFVFPSSTLGQTELPTQLKYAKPWSANKTSKQFFLEKKNTETNAGITAVRARRKKRLQGSYFRARKATSGRRIMLIRTRALAITTTSLCLPACLLLQEKASTSMRISLRTQTNKPSQTKHGQHRPETEQTLHN